MSKKIKVIIDEPPRIKPATSIGIVHGHVHTWNKSTEARKKLQWKIQSILTPEQKEVLTKDPKAEIHIKIGYFLPIPASASQKEKNLMMWGVTAHTSKPDYDNLTKFHNDVGNGTLWSDDRQITNAGIRKRYSPNPRTEYTVEVVDTMAITKEMRQVLEIYSPAEVGSLIDDVWQIFEMYDTTIEVESIESKALLDLKLVKTACILSKIARNHAKKLGIIAKKFPDLDIQNHIEEAKGSSN
jgi:Holliday junction resolvase RusA-like endonuclease